MRNFWRVGLVAMMGGVWAGPSAAAQVATFDDVPAGTLGSPYLGYTWSGFSVVPTPLGDPSDDGQNPNPVSAPNLAAFSGLCSATVSACGPTGRLYGIISSPTAFRFDGGYFRTADASGPGRLAVTGYLNGSPVYAATFSPTFVHASQTQQPFYAAPAALVDSLTFVTEYDEYLYMDNLGFNGWSTPEPSTLALLGTGLVALGPFVRRRRR